LIEAGHSRVGLEGFESTRMRASLPSHSNRP
jgi:hypothetical protein